MKPFYNARENRMEIIYMGRDELPKAVRNVEACSINPTKKN